MYYYKENGRFDVLQTHIEISPYIKGDNFSFEKTLSKWNDVKHRYEPVGYYIDNNVLYLPRGISIDKISHDFGLVPNMSIREDSYKKFKSYHICINPKDNDQRNAISFLTTSGNYTNGNLYSQFALLTGTGSGKTYCMCNSIIQMRIKSIIISHQNKIKNQWIETFKSISNIEESELIDIDGSEYMDKIMEGKISGSVYFINHQTICSYARNYGWSKVREFFKKIEVGVKVYDEAHKFFNNILMIDFFSNVYRTYYITATFSRENYIENRVFKQAFSNVYKYGAETKLQRRKHVIYVPVIFNSNPNPKYLVKMQTRYGFSSYNYINYALYRDENHTLINVLLQVMSQVYDDEGKHLIVSPLIDSVDYIANCINKYFLEKPLVIHSKTDKNTDDLYEEIDSKRILSSTIKSLGTGVDIPGLRFLYCLEPHSSKSLTEQLVGRLREYSPDKNTVFFDFFDMGISPFMESIYKSHMSVMSNIAVEIREMKF